MKKSSTKKTAAKKQPEMSDKERELVYNAGVIKRGVMREIKSYGARVKGTERFVVKLACGHSRNARKGLNKARCRKCDRPKALLEHRDSLLKKASDIRARYN